jgi:FtsP/CotA-like multicopper oxidase with cupredoxin domain
MLSRRAVMSSAAVAPVHAEAQSAGSEAPSTLRVQRRSLEVNGKPSVLGIGQLDGTPGLVIAVGRNFRARVENHLDVPTLIHWHGLAPPWNQDGVPGISAPPIPPGGIADYDFPLRFGGTFWMRRLRALEPLALRKADRVHVVNLTGTMAGYIWSINGVVWNKDTPPLPVSAGQRVELVYDNRTPMPHPMHLHGHTFQVVEIDGKRFSGARRDTVLVTPGTRVVVAFDADNPGWWAMHCHLLYHMDAGMFATVRYV